MAKKESSDSQFALETYERYFSCLRAIKDNPIIGGFDGGGLNYHWYKEFDSLVELGLDAMPTVENIIRSDGSNIVAAHAAMAIESIDMTNFRGVKSDDELRTKLLDLLEGRTARQTGPLNR